MHQFGVFIIGAQKCGTTSFLEYFRQHPDVNAQVPIEMTFFYDKKEYDKGNNFLLKNYFDSVNKNQFLVGKHATATRSLDELKRLKEHSPDCKLIYIVRDPIKRAFSSYQMEKRNGSIHHNFSEVVDIGLREKHDDELGWYKNVILDLGLYSQHLRNALKYFDKNNIKVIALEELRNDPEIFIELLKWLNLKTEVNINLEVKHNEAVDFRFGWIKKILILINNLVSRSGVSLSISKKQRIKNIISSINSKKTEKAEIIHSQTIDLLSDYFKEFNNELNEQWDFDTRNWK